ncbi:hypothetical protein NPIL_87531, partial [Nephila pilipes]
MLSKLKRNNAVTLHSIIHSLHSAAIAATVCCLRRTPVVTVVYHSNPQVSFAARCLHCHSPLFAGHYQYSAVVAKYL